MPVRPCRREGGKGSVRLFLRLMGVASVGCILAAEGLPYRSRGWIGTWTTHGPHMDHTCMDHTRTTRTTHGPHMDHTWAAHGPHMGRTWTTHGPHMDHTWAAHGRHMDHTWAAHGPHGPHMGRTWNTHGPHMDHTWTTHVSMVRLYIHQMG